MRELRNDYLAIKLILRGDAVISVAKEDEGCQPTVAKNTIKAVAWHSLSFNQCDMTISISRRCVSLISPSPLTPENEKWSGKPNLSSPLVLLAVCTTAFPFVGLVIHRRGREDTFVCQLSSWRQPKGAILPRNHPFQPFRPSVFNFRFNANKKC